MTPAEAWRRFKWRDGQVGQGYSTAYKRLVPIAVRRWGGPWEWVREIRGRTRGLGWRTIHRTQNRWWDFCAVTAGFCNARANKGGYRHWRCARRRGHLGVHRSNNYIWGDDPNGRVQYDPIPHQAFCPRQPWRRTMTPTIRQAREQARAVERRIAARQTELAS